MKSTNATTLDRKSGVATCPGSPWKWRDLRLSFTRRQPYKGAPIPAHGTTRKSERHG